jgi:IS1 transposase
VLKISPTTVINELKKKEAALISVNEPLLNALFPRDVEVIIRRADEAEVDEMWSFVGKKKEQRWLWHAIGAP